MKFSMSLRLLSISILIFVKLNEAYDFGPLIKNIHDKYKTTGVIIMTGTNDLSFEKITIWHETVRMLSNEGISTRIINFRQFRDKLQLHQERTVRSLIVIVFDTIEELHTFESNIKDLYMKHAIWLIFFARNANENVCEFCRKPHGSLSNPTFAPKVLISCCDSDIIEEWRYSEDNRTRRRELGRLMDENRKIVWFPNDLINGRRYSLDGRILRIVAMTNSSNFWVKDGDYYGFVGELLRELSQVMNFKISEIIWEDEPGTRNSETLNWTGVIGRIHRREADISANVYYMSPERYEAVSFTSPIVVERWQLHFRTYDVPDLVWNAHFKALTVGVWMVIIGLILIVPIVLMVIKYKRGSHFFPLLFKQYLYVWGIYCQQGLPEFPNELPSKIVYVTILLSALVTSGAYSAALIRSLATPPYSPFNTMEQFVNDGTYKLIVLKGFASSQMYKFSDNTFTNKLMSLLKPYHLRPRTNGEAFEQVCNERAAFYATDLSKKLINMIPCEITSITIGRTANGAIMMPRNSEYLDIVNYHIRRFKRNGIVRRLVNHYSTVTQRDKHDFSPVILRTVAPILVILAVGFLIAFIIVIIERNFCPSRKKPEIFIRPLNRKTPITLTKNPRHVHFQRNMPKKFRWMN